MLAWLDLRLRLLHHRHHQQLVPEQHRLPARDDRLRRDHLGAGAVGAAVPGRPAGGALPEPGASPGAASGHRRLLRHHPADHDGAGAVLPRGDRGGAQDPALRRAAGVPVPAGRAVAGRSAQPAVGRAQGDAGGCPAVAGRADGMARPSRGSGSPRTLEQFEMSEELRRRIPSPSGPRSRSAMLADRVQPGRRAGCGCGWPRKSSTTTSTGSSPNRCSARWPTTSPRSAPR